MIYVTFVSHYGAIRFKQRMEAAGVPVTLMPVPRFLSSSCGTCARMEGDAVGEDMPMEDVEGVYVR